MAFVARETGSVSSITIRGRRPAACVRAIRAWLTAAGVLTAAVALPRALRPIAAHVASSLDVSAVEWWLATAWFAAVAAGACIAVRCGRWVSLAAGWRAWRIGALRFAASGIALVALLSTRAGALGAAFEADRASLLARTTLLPALTEELVFRGIATSMVGASLAVVVRGPRVRAGLTLVLVSITFALAHEGTSWPAVGWPLIAARSAAGLVFGVLALGDRSLLAPMLAHAMYDAAVARCW